MYIGRPNRQGTQFVIQGSEIRHSHCSASHNSANNTVVEHTRVEWTVSGHFATSGNLINYTYIASRYLSVRINMVTLFYTIHLDDYYVDTL